MKRLLELEEIIIKQLDSLEKEFVDTIYAEMEANLTEYLNLAMKVRKLTGSIKYEDVYDELSRQSSDLLIADSQKFLNKSS